MGSSPSPSNPDGPEFSRPVEVTQVGPAGLTLAIEAGADERKRLAERLGVNEIRVLTADVRLAQRGAGIAVAVDWRAEVVQDCVVTLDPVEARLAGKEEIVFGPPEAEPAPGEEIEIDPEDADPAEPIVNGRIDVGEVVAEQLALHIDPYPRKPGAVFEGKEPEAEAKVSPFAVLGGWGRKE